MAVPNCRTGLEDHQHRGNREHSDDPDRDLLEHYDLGVDTARHTIVGDIDAVSLQYELRHRIDELHENEANRADQAQAHCVLDYFLRALGYGQRGRAENEREHRQDEPQRHSCERQQHIVPGRFGTRRKRLQQRLESTGNACEQPGET